MLDSWDWWREREREKGLRKENSLKLMKKKNHAEGDEEPGEREKRGEVKINNCRGYWKKRICMKWDKYKSGIF